MENQQIIYKIKRVKCGDLNLYKFKIYKKYSFLGFYFWFKQQSTYNTKVISDFLLLNGHVTDFQEYD